MGIWVNHIIIIILLLLHFSCLFGEMFGKRQPILASRPPTPTNQLELIYQLCGTPSGETEERLKNCDGWDKYQFSKVYEPKLREKFESIPSSAIDLLEKLLCLNPDQRITAEQALNHPYFSDGMSSVPERLPRIPISIEEIHEYDIQKKKTEDDSSKRSYQEGLQFLHQQNQQNSHHHHNNNHNHHGNHNHHYNNQRLSSSSSSSSSQINGSGNGNVIGTGTKEGKEFVTSNSTSTPATKSTSFSTPNHHPDPRMRSKNIRPSPNQIGSELKFNNFQSNRKSL